MIADPKPPRRIKADQNDWIRLRREKLNGRLCRVCENRPAEELHHLVPRGMGGGSGDDVADNLIPICKTCHSLIELRDPWASSLLGQRLASAERQYVIGKRGAWYLEKRYGLKVAA